MADQHLIDFNESDRADYMAVVASMAGADGHVSSEEILALRELCKHFVLGPDARGRVMAATIPGAEDMDATLHRLAATDLRYSLMLDLCAMGWRDGKLVEVEEAEIRRLAGALGIEAGQVGAMIRFAEALHKGGATEAALHEIEAAGVSRSALALSATLYGMGQAGVGGARETLQAL